MHIIKRNGSEAEFDPKKIIAAVGKANASVAASERIGQPSVDALAERVTGRCAALGRAPSVEEVQDFVEEELHGLGAFALSRHYIRYRHARELARRANTTDAPILSLIDCNNEEVKQENSNKNPTVNSVQRDYMAGEVSKDLSKRVLLPPEIVEAHEAGIFHFHDMDYYAQRMHNCFAGTTKFITDRGIRKFNDFKDGDPVVVKDLNGDLRDATVHCFGVQELYDVTLKNGRMTHTVTCTRDHRWVLDDGSVTTQLSVGDVLWPTQDSTGFEISTVEDAKLFCLGFAIGDGCDHCCAHRTIVRLCGAKTRWAWVFEKSGWRKTEVEATGDVWFHVSGTLKQDFLSSRAWRFLNARQQAMVFHGYYAADGSADATRVSTADKRVSAFVRDVSGLAGYYLTSSKETLRNTNFKEGAFLCTMELTVSNASNQKWRVASIVRNRHQRARVWCVTEPVTHTFTLEKGIVTGNCDLVNLDDMLQNGTVISGTGIDRPHSFSTACNIATQIIAQVASNQYGGQSISLAHLAPFVEVSRHKIRK